MKVYVRSPYSEKALDELKKLFEEVIYQPWTETGERYYEDKMLENLLKIKPQILITELDRVTEKVLEGYSDLTLIGDCRANPANIDVAACTRYNIPLICTPARNAQAVAEYIVGMIIYYWRNFAHSIEWVKEGKWIKGTTPYFNWMGSEIHGKKVGLVGLGAVGKSLAKILTAFGAEISYYDPYIPEIPGYINKNIESIFRDSDIVSLHLPVTDETRNMIDNNLFDLMKPEALLINSSRAEVVNQDDLLDLAKNNKIGGILLDVLLNEPPNEKDLEIIKYDNVILTPHIAGATFDVTEHQARIMNERLKKWLNKEDLNLIVFNKEVL